MEEKIRRILEEDAETREYSQYEIDIAVRQIGGFLSKLKQLKVIENNQERPLNQLEQFIAINEFVTNRVYEENKQGERRTSHNVVGVCITNKSVCEGFCKLTQLLCNQVGIRTLYKHSYVTDEMGRYMGPHSNIEVYLMDRDGKGHCLHNDSTIDSLKSKEIMTYNSTLIADENINKYYHAQYWEPTTNSIWVDLTNGVSKAEQNEKLAPNPMDEILGNYKIGNFRTSLIEMASFMGINYNSDLSTKEELLALYELVYNEYERAKVPIINQEFLDALINVQKANLLYETDLSQEEIEEKSKQIIKDRIQVSITMQQREWNGECGKSFIVDIVNGEFNYDEELERHTIISLRNPLKRALKKGITFLETADAEKNEIIERSELEKNEYYL